MLNITSDLLSINRIVSIDMETTGQRALTPAEVLRQPRGLKIPGIIIQIGCVEMLRDGRSWKIGETWETLVNPDCGVHPQAMKVHGIHPAMLKKAPRFSEVVAEFERIVGDGPMLAHSAWNEIDFLNYEMKRAKLAAPDANPYGEDRFFDTQILAEVVFPGAPRSLDVLLDRLWIDRSPRFERHGALLDAELTAEAFIKIVGGFTQDETRSFSV